MTEQLHNRCLFYWWRYPSAICSKSRCVCHWSLLERVSWARAGAASRPRKFIAVQLLTLIAPFRLSYGAATAIVPLLLGDIVPPSIRGAAVQASSVSVRSFKLDEPFADSLMVLDRCHR